MKIVKSYNCVIINLYYIALSLIQIGIKLYLVICSNAIFTDTATILILHTTGPTAQTQLSQMQHSCWSL
jgi:hypothetical protein